MALLDDVATRIATLAISGYAIIKGRLPDDQNKVIGLFEYPGQPSETGFGVSGVQFEWPGLQIVARGAPGDYEDPRTQLETVYRDLVSIQGTQLSGGAFYHLFRARSAPFFLRTDERDRVLIACNFIVEKRPE